MVPLLPFPSRSFIPFRFASLVETSALPITPPCHLLSGSLVYFYTFIQIVPGLINLPLPYLPPSQPQNAPPWLTCNYSQCLYCIWQDDHKEALLMGQDITRHPIHSHLFFTSPCLLNGHYSYTDIMDLSFQTRYQAFNAIGAQPHSMEL